MWRSRRPVRCPSCAVRVRLVGLENGDDSSTSSLLSSFFAMPRRFDAPAAAARGGERADIYQFGDRKTTSIRTRLLLLSYGD